MLRRGVALFIFALLSAGCLANAPTPSADLHANAAAPPGLRAPNATAEVPTWTVGDAWSITTNGGQSGGSSDHSVLVVTSADSSGYVLSTTSDTLASFDAQSDISYVGKIRAADLAGSQQGNPVAFFAFPLRDGLQWSARWDNKTINMSAKALGADGSFGILASDGAKTYASYDYQPALKWWSHLDFASGYTLKVDRFSANWTGEYRIATAKKILESTTVFPTATINAAPFTVDTGQTSVALSLRGSAPGYARALAIQAPDNTPYQPSGSATEAQPTGGGFVTQENLPPTAGTWHIEAPVAHEPGGFFALTIQEIKLETRRI